MPFRTNDSGARVILRRCRDAAMPRCRDDGNIVAIVLRGMDDKAFSAAGYLRSLCASARESPMLSECRRWLTILPLR